MCRMPPDDDAMKAVILAATASLTACRCQVWMYCTETTSFYPDNISILKVFHRSFDDGDLYQDHAQVNESASPLQRGTTALQILPQHAHSLTTSSHGLA